MTADEDFVNQLKQGRPAAYELLVERFEGPLYRFFFCDHREHHTAQEQTSETFTRLVRGLPGMRGGPEQLRAFVFATARHIQQRRWRRRHKSPVSLETAFEICDTQPSPASQVATTELLQRVLNAIGAFDQPLRQILLLRFVEGLSTDEVAEAMEMPSGTVKSHIHRGRARLRQLFFKEECNHE